MRLARNGKLEDNIATIEPIPVHGEMASRASTTRETVARVVSELTKTGILKREKNALLVCDFDRLEQMVEEVRGF